MAATARPDNRQSVREMFGRCCTCWLCQPRAVRDCCMLGQSTAAAPARRTVPGRWRLWALMLCTLVTVRDTTTPCLFEEVSYACMHPCIEELHFSPVFLGTCITSCRHALLENQAFVHFTLVPVVFWASTDVQNRLLVMSLGLFSTGWSHQPVLNRATSTGTKSSQY